MKIGFIINSLLADLDNLKKQFLSANRFNFELHFYPTLHARHAEELTLKAVEDGCKWIVSTGGDGTLNEVINALIDKGYNQKVKVALLPYGTGNDYSLSIKTVIEPGILLETISKNSTRKVDAGKVKYNNGRHRYFINVADAGLGGEVTRMIKTSGNPFGRWVYYKTIIRTFFTFQRPVLRISHDGESMEKKIITVVIGKGRSFAGGYKIPYKAKIDDGRFFVAVVGNLSFFTYLINIPSLLAGRHIKHRDVHYFYASEVKIENLSETKCFFEMDGEPGEACHAEITCLPGAITILDLTGD